MESKCLSSAVKLPIHPKFVFWRKGGGGDSEAPRFPGERRVSLAREGDSNGHQASFQPERKGKGGGVVKSREVMKTIHPSPDVSDTGREKEGLKFWKLSLKCVNQSHGRGTSLQVSVRVDLLYQLFSFTSVGNCFSCGFVFTLYY